MGSRQRLRPAMAASAWRKNTTSSGNSAKRGSIRSRRSRDPRQRRDQGSAGTPGLDPAWIEDVTFAQSYANSETPCVGRWIALEAGLPIAVPGLQIDRRCGGGLQALATAAMMVQTGACDVVIAEGVESMSRIEFYTTDMRWGRRSGTTQLYDRLDRGRERSQPVERFGHISGMIETAERSRANMRCRGRRRISSPAKATGARGGHGMKALFRPRSFRCRSRGRRATPSSFRATRRPRRHDGGVAGEAPSDPEKRRHYGGQCSAAE